MDGEEGASAAGGGGDGVAKGVGDVWGSRPGGEEV